MFQSDDDLTGKKNGGRFVFQNDEMLNQMDTGKKLTRVLCCKQDRDMNKMGIG